MESTYLIYEISSMTEIHVIVKQTEFLKLLSHYKAQSKKSFSFYYNSCILLVLIKCSLYSISPKPCYFNLDLEIQSNNDFFAAIVGQFNNISISHYDLVHIERTFKQKHT